MLRTISLFITLLVVAGYGVPQTLKTPETPAPASGKLTMERLAAAIKASLRDSAEFPLNVQISMVAVGPSGLMLKKDYATGRYLFHGYNPRSENAKVHGHLNIGLFHYHQFLVPALRNGIAATTFPSFFLLKDVNDAEKVYALEASDPSANSQLLSAKMSPRPGACAEFKWATKKGAPKEFCGSGQFEVQKDDLSLRRFSFDAGALPIAATVKPFGQCELRSYHADVEFQKVTLPDDPKPFLVPKHVEVVVETDKGKLDMTTDYTLSKQH